jgi:hypothetical protein
VLLLCDEERATRVVEPTEGSVCQRDTGIDERERDADAGGDHPPPTHLEPLARLGRLPGVDFENAETPGRHPFLHVAGFIEALFPQRTSRFAVTAGVHDVAEHAPAPRDEIAQTLAVREFERCLDICARCVVLAREEQREADVLLSVGQAPVVACRPGQLRGALERRQRRARVAHVLDDAEDAEGACLDRPVGELLRQR